MSHPTDSKLLQCINGELMGSLKDEVERHVKECLSCSERLDRLNREPVIEGPSLGQERAEQLSSNSGPQATVITAGNRREPPCVVPGYEFIGELGSGGMGEVYRAFDPRLNRFVALKRLKGAQMSPEGLERFRREGQSLAHLHHPHIVQVYALHETEDGPVLVLEYVSGGSLMERLNGPLPPPAESARLAAILAQAVQAAHENGIVHRDLKPANVLMASRVAGSANNVLEGFPKVADFGLAKFLDPAAVRLTASGVALGTPCYMSPEQVQSGKVGYAADVWGLGAILYHCLTGRPPFSGNDAWGTLAQVITNNPEPPSHLNPAVPRELETICLKCLKKDPSERYPSAEALADELTRFLAYKSIAPEPSLSDAPRESEIPHAVAETQRERGGTLEPLPQIGVLSLGAEIDTVLSMSFSPDRKLLLTAGSDNKARWWGAEKGQETLVLKGKTEGALRLAISPDGRTLLTGSADGMAQLWDVEKDQQIVALKVQASWRLQPSFSSDSKLLLTRGEGPARLWNAKTGEEELTLKTDVKWRSRASFSADGTRIVALGSDGRGHLWDLRTGEFKRAFPVEAAGVDRLAFTSDGKLILARSNFKTVDVWDAETGHHFLKNEQKGVFVFTFSPDCTRMLITVNHDRILMNEPPPLLWDLLGPSVIGDLTPASCICCAAFSHDGTIIATGSIFNGVKLWDGLTGQPESDFRGYSQGVSSVGFSPDSKLILAGCDDGVVRAWDTATSEEKYTLKGHTAAVMNVAFSPDGRYITTNDGLMRRLWNARTGEEMLVPKGHTAPVTSVAFSPDGKRILTGSWDGTARLWNVATGEELLAFKTRYLLRCVAFSPDSKRIFTGTNGEACLWNAKTGQALDTEQGNGGRTNYHIAAFSRNGKRVLAGEDHFLSGGESCARVQVWDTGTGRFQLSFTVPDTKRVISASFSPDSNLILTGGDDGTARLWFERKEIRAFKGHTKAVTSVAFSPDGKRILTGSKDTTARLWNATSGELLQTFQWHRGAVMAITFGLEGRTAMTAGIDGVRIWDLECCH